MLVTFKCDHYAHITMFGDVALRLLKLMGHSGTVPGAISAEEVPTALAHLNKAVAQQKVTSSDTNPPNDEDLQDQPVSLATRALPLIDLLNFAAKEKIGVMWE